MKKDGVMDLQDLLSLARNAANRAYAPYSKFRVGAAVLAGDHVFVGTNVENASYGLSLCAERSALSAWIAAGGEQATGPVTAVAVACVDAPAQGGVAGAMPCGACRQWLVELAPDALLIVPGMETPMAVRDLLPLAFGLERER